MVGGNEWEIFFLFSGAIFPVRFCFTRRDLPTALPVRLTPKVTFNGSY